MHIEVSRVVTNSIDTVWTRLSDFGRPHLVDPTITTIYSAGEGVGATRTIKLPGGESATELCVVSDPETFTLAYTILPPAAVPLKNYVSTVSLKWAGPGLTEVTWVQISEFVEDDRFLVTEEQFVAMAHKVYAQFIDGLEKAR